MEWKTIENNGKGEKVNKKKKKSGDGCNNMMCVCVCDNNIFVHINQYFQIVKVKDDCRTNSMTKTMNTIRNKGKHTNALNLVKHSELEAI